MSTGRAAVRRLAARAVVLATGLFCPPRWDRARVRALVDAGLPDVALLTAHAALSDDAPRSTDDIAWLHYNAGRAAHTKGLLDQARSHFARAAALQPDEPLFAYGLGWALRDEKRLASAVEALERAEALRPNDARVAYLLGVTLRDVGRLDDAVAALERALAQDARHVRATYALGLCHYERRRYAEAVTRFEAVTRAEPENMRGHYQQGAAWLALGQIDRALPSLRRALDLRADYAPTHFALGRALATQDPVAARAHLLAALTHPPVVTLAWLELGQLNEREGRTAQAISAYGDYLRAHPNAAGAEALRRHVDGLRRSLDRAAA